MKVVILAGGLGIRLGERSIDIPKPMVLIGGRPIQWDATHLEEMWLSGKGVLWKVW